MQDSSLVFVGSLTEIQPAADNLVELHFDVRLSFKGDVGATVDVASFASAEDCGIGETARRGSWLVFAYTFPGGSGLPLLSTCSPSTPLKRRRVSTTAASSAPIRKVPAGWWSVLALAQACSK